MTHARDSYQARRVTRLAVDPDVRDVRIVHELDGMTHAVAPDRMLGTGKALWRAWRDNPRHRMPDMLLGLDAGGIPPTIALALAASLPYHLAWKLNLDLPHKRVFHEPHARRTEVFTYARFTSRRVLVVDDEITTGNTAANLITVLRDAGADVVGVLCLVEDLTHSGRAHLEQMGVPLCTLTQL